MPEVLTPHLAGWEPLPRSIQAASLGTNLNGEMLFQGPGGHFGFFTSLPKYKNGDFLPQSFSAFPFVLLP